MLLRLFNGFFWSIQIHKGQLEMVKKAATEVRGKDTHDKLSQHNLLPKMSKTVFSINIENLFLIAENGNG